MRSVRRAGTKHRAPLFGLLGANVVSEVGNVMTFVAVPWFVLQTTGSPAKTGLAGAAATLAAVAAGIFGGPIVDRLGFKRTSVLADLSSGVAVALIPLLYYTSGLDFWQLLALVFLGAFLDAPGLTARQSIVPDVAKMADAPVERANSAFQAIQQFSFLLGPPLAGLLITTLGATSVLWLDAATFALSATMVATLIPTPGPSAKPDREDLEGGDSGIRRYFAELREGLKFLIEDRLIFWIVATSVALNFLLFPLLSAVLPVLAANAYDSAAALGILLGAFGGGALAGSLIYGAVGHRLPRRATVFASLVILGLPLTVLAVMPSLTVAASALAFTGFAVGPPNPLVFTVVQERTPPMLLGRVTGALLALSMTAAPFGAVFFGFALEAFGLSPVLLGISVTCILVSVFSLLNPVFRELDKTR